MTPVPFHVHNTLSGKKELFEPLEPGRIKMYVCGVTPYDACHLGHARCYVTFDFIRRALARLGYAVTHVQNFTDVDDKIIRRAQERGEGPSALAERYILDYFEKMDRLNVLRSDAYPRVTGHIPQIVAFIEELVRKEMAYRVEGDVYYAVRKFPSYGRLSKHSLDDLRAGARVEVDERKHDPLDFALWKAAKPGEPSWDSPWGTGRPGWHIECSVMSLTNLKADTFDIHGGGQDLIFPHHENEIAQAEGKTGRPFARYWVHNGFVTVNKEKMSKSLGNFFTLDEIFARYEPRAVRYMLLGQHYRGPLEFSHENLEAAVASLRDMTETFDRLDALVRQQRGGDRQDDKVLEERYASFEQDLTEALADDFNSPKVFAALHTMVGELKTRTATHKSISVAAVEKGLALARGVFDGLLGIPFGAGADAGDAAGTAGIEALVVKRDAARRAKDWAEADRLRKELADRDVIIEDTPKGARWWRRHG